MTTTELCFYVIALHFPHFSDVKKRRPILQLTLHNDADGLEANLVLDDAMAESMHKMFLMLALNDSWRARARLLNRRSSLGS
jgi:hypothetical protein